MTGNHCTRGWVAGMVAMGLVASVAWGADAPGAAAHWPSFRGPHRDGKSADTGLLKAWPDDGPAKLWEINGIGKGFSSVAVIDGSIFITGNVDGRLVLTSLTMDGKTQWKVPIDRAWTRSVPGARATPTIEGDSLYLLSDNGVLVCLRPKTGKTVWSKDLKSLGGRPGSWGYAESVLLYKDLAIAKPGGRNCIVAFNKKTGQQVWASEGFSAGPEYSSCLLFTHGGKDMIATGTKNGIVCVSPDGGKLLWSNRFSARNTANCPTPAYADGHVFWANGYGKGGICLKLTDDGKATEAWRTRDMVCHHGGYIIHEGHIYGNNGGGYACLNLKSGEKKWSERGPGKGSLCFADGMLYLFGERGGRAMLATCSPDGMEITGKVTVKGSGPSWAHPVVIGGRLYLRYDDNLYCFNVKAQ